MKILKKNYATAALIFTASVSFSAVHEVNVDGTHITYVESSALPRLVVTSSSERHELSGEFDWSIRGMSHNGNQNFTALENEFGSVTRDLSLNLIGRDLSKTYQIIVTAPFLYKTPSSQALSSRATLRLALQCINGASNTTLKQDQERDSSKSTVNSSTGIIDFTLNPQVCPTNSFRIYTMLNQIQRASFSPLSVRVLEISTL